MFFVYSRTHISIGIIREQVDFYNCYNLTGLYPQIISIIFHASCQDIQMASARGARTMTVWNRLLLVLTWMRSGSTLMALASQWSTSPTFCFRTIRQIIPILYEKVKVIKMFDEQFLKQFPMFIGETEVHGALDCTCHRRDRVHPGQSKFYRGDKHFHFFSAQVTVSFSGLYSFIVLAYGHNNDQVFN